MAGTVFLPTPLPWAERQVVTGLAAAGWAEELAAVAVAGAGLCPAARAGPDPTRG